MNNVIDVGCTSCGKAYEVPERGAGRKAECPNCGATMMVPQVIEDSSVQQSSAEPKQIHQQDSARPVYSTPGPRLAIDFGTTRTKVAYWNDDKNQPDLINIGIEIRTSIPSAFYIPVTGTTNIQVGDDASDNVHTDPAGVVIGLKKEIHRPGKKRIGQGRPALGRVELASFLFKHIREYCEDNSFRKQSITSCTLTIPVTFEQKKRDCIRRAAELGGFTDVDLLEEPVAAARHWIASRQARDTGYVFVCDVGGGTIDFALLKQDEDQFVSVPEAITAGSPKGGDDLDADIFEASVGLGEVTTEVVTEYRSGFLSKIRQLRERFGRTGQTRPVNIKGKSLEIAGDTVRECVDNFVDFVYMRLEEFIQHCHQKVPNCGTPPILLVGGGSKIEGLKEKLESNSDWEIINWEDADYAVVLGAAGAIGASLDSLPTESSVAEHITSTPGDVQVDSTLPAAATRVTPIPDASEPVVSVEISPDHVQGNEVVVAPIVATGKTRVRGISREKKMSTGIKVGVGFGTAIIVFGILWLLVDSSSRKNALMRDDPRQYFVGKWHIISRSQPITKATLWEDGTMVLIPLDRKYPELNRWPGGWEYANNELTTSHIDGTSRDTTRHGTIIRKSNNWFRTRDRKGYYWDWQRR